MHDHYRGPVETGPVRAGYSRAQIVWLVFANLTIGVFITALLGALATGVFALGLSLGLVYGRGA